MDVRIVRAVGYSDFDTKRIVESLSSKIGGGMTLTVSFIDTLTKTPRGKHQWLVQELNIASYLPGRTSAVVGGTQ